MVKVICGSGVKIMQEISGERQRGNWEGLWRQDWGKAWLRSFRTYSQDRAHKIFPIWCDSSKVMDAEAWPHRYVRGPHLYCPGTAHLYDHILGLIIRSSLSEILNYNLEARLQTSSLSALLLRTQFKSADPLCFTSFLPSMNPTGHQSELVCSAPSQLSLPTLAL